MKKFSVLVIVVILSFQSALSQFTNSGFSFLTFSRTVPSYGLAEQGVTLRNSTEGMVYNPANLAFERNLQITYFYDPFYFIFPGTTYKYFAANYSPIENLFVGIDYYLNAGEYTVSTDDGRVSQKVYFHQRSISLNAAQELSEELNYGIQIRYSWLSFPSIGREFNGNLFSFGGGINYQPALFNKRVLFGLSLMNLGQFVKYKESPSRNIFENDVPPTVMYLGTTIDAVKATFVTVGLHLQTSKLLAKYNEDATSYSPQSSFQSLFNDWHDAPRDMILSSGISIYWKPINLGRNWTLEQTWYIGHRNTGPKLGNNVSYFNGIELGVGFNGLHCSIGYAGETYNSSDFDRIFSVDLPKEVFQFKLGIDGIASFELDKAPIMDVEPANEPSSVTLSLGMGHVNRLGLNTIRTSGNFFWIPAIATISYQNSYEYNIEVDFYFTEQSAFVAQFSYSNIPLQFSLKESANSQNKLLEMEFQNGTVQLLALYRNHFLEFFQPLFLEGGVGIQRMNPIEDTSPKYSYYTLFQGGLGLQLFINNSIVLLPKAGFSSVLREIISPVKRIGGHNQFYVTLNIGYSIY